MEVRSVKVLNLCLAAKGGKHAALDPHGNVVWELDGGCHVVTAFKFMRKQHPSGQTTSQECSIKFCLIGMAMSTAAHAWAIHTATVP